MAEQDKSRSIEVDYRGPKHSGQVILNRWRLWVSIVGGTILISTAIGSAAVWGGNQIWHTKEEAREELDNVNDKIHKITNSLEQLVQQIDRLEGQVSQTNRNLSNFIAEAERQRLESQIQQTESDIYQYENRIEDQGSQVGALYRQRLQNLRSKRDRLKRELKQLYDNLPSDRRYRHDSFSQ